ncbi:MAG: FMN-binding protein [Saprospiraceae bacterium]
MSSPDTIEIKAPSNDKKMLVAMAGIGVICALLIVLTFEGTFSIIEKNKAEALEKAIFKVIPDITNTKAFELKQDQSFAMLVPGSIGTSLIYAGYDDQDQLKGIAVKANGQGYGEVLNILYGYDPDAQKIIGFYVLESKETPGLGDKIEKDPIFLANFEALDVALDEDLNSLKNEITTVKRGVKTKDWEIDGITGATISSRAIGDILSVSTKQWLPLIYKHKDTFVMKDKTEK